jgi:hypothetical protein
VAPRRWGLIGSAMIAVGLFDILMSYALGSHLLLLVGLFAIAMGAVVLWLSSSPIA